MQRFVIPLEKDWDLLTLNSNILYLYLSDLHSSTAFESQSFYQDAPNPASDQEIPIPIF